MGAPPRQRPLRSEFRKKKVSNIESGLLVGNETGERGAILGLLAGEDGALLVGRDAGEGLDGGAACRRGHGERGR
eukprot:11215810-Lingulodinium_polyedra.AAC.1